MSKAKAVRSMLNLVDRLNRHAEEQRLRHDTAGRAARTAACPQRSAAHWRQAALAAMECNTSRGVAATLSRRAREIQAQAA